MLITLEDGTLIELEDCTFVQCKRRAFIVDEDKDGWYELFECDDTSGKHELQWKWRNTRSKENRFVMPMTLENGDREGEDE